MEEEIVYVRFVTNGEATTKLANVEAHDSADAAGLLKSIQLAIASLNNPDTDKEVYLSSVYKKLVNVNFDGASVMSGHLSGVQKRLKDLQPGLVYTHCVAHRFELAVLDSIKSDDAYLTKFDETVNSIFKFYYYSAVRRKELKAIGDLLQEEFQQLGLLKKIRWLASRARALRLLEANYKALVYDLESKSYGTSETAKKALGYADFIKKPPIHLLCPFFARSS